MIETNENGELISYLRTQKYYEIIKQNYDYCSANNILNDLFHGKYSAAYKTLIIKASIEVKKYLIENAVKNSLIPNNQSGTILLKLLENIINLYKRDISQSLKTGDIELLNEIAQIIRSNFINIHFSFEERKMESRKRCTENQHNLNSDSDWILTG